MYSSSCILMISSGCFKLIRRSSWFSFECGTFWYLQQESFFWNPIREMELHRADPWKNYYFDQFHMQFKVPHNAEDWQNQKWSDLYPFRLLCFSVIYAKKNNFPLVSTSCHWTQKTGKIWSDENQLRKLQRQRQFDDFPGPCSDLKISHLASQSANM